MAEALTASATVLDDQFPVSAIYNLLSEEYFVLE
jgi:hypothetical protein